MKKILLILSLLLIGCSADKPKEQQKVSFDEYIPSPEELSHDWWNYSRDKLKNKLTQIMTHQDSNGNFVYSSYPEYKWSEATGLTTTYGTLQYQNNGEGFARMYNNYTNQNYDESGSWKIQWAPVSNNSPYSSDIIFTINMDLMYSPHIGSDNTLWTSIDSFCKEHFNAADAESMMVYGDSLRNAFMNEKGLTIGPDGRFKRK
ncbi:MAG: hypothetical protein QF712_00215 [Candidatus Marinimicrobia bacterium]|jgi:hypothetical protein|nr:hypothetical protein [Candidatus Neomarinimicrobiota bacterium]|tara:strand:+ start:52 stop:660 length:609 start_codon:yes stop_codon:yes gene_type:complete